MNTSITLKSPIDAILVLSQGGGDRWFDWALEELIGTFAPEIPVIYVTADLMEPRYAYGVFGQNNRVALHVFQEPGVQQSALINEALREKKILRPLLWVEDLAFTDFIINRYSPLKVFQLASALVKQANNLKQMKSLFKHCDLLLADSSEAELEWMNLAQYQGQSFRLVSSSNQLDEENRIALQEVFSQAVSAINTPLAQQTKPLNILMLYGGDYSHVKTIQNYLESFSLYSQNNIHYAAVNRFSPNSTDFSPYDVVMVHYSLRICFKKTELGRSFEKALQEYAGYKILFIQDEYDNTEITRRHIEQFGIHTVFTCVPENYVEAVYPASRFPAVKFISVLTGYVSPDLEFRRDVKPMAERKNLIGYRGRELAYKYGNLAREKLFIGVKMREICKERNLLVDIEWEESKRIYGDAWYEFLEDSKATLGTESGANVFDDHGTISQSIEKALAQNPELTYEEIWRTYLAEHEDKVMMNQVSPKIFESIALGTALVLFEGEYSGVVQADTHFIPLKKDFSNIDNVLAKLHDDDYLQAMTERAYNDVIASRNYTYEKYIQAIDHFLAGEMKHRKEARFHSVVIAHQYPDEEAIQIHDYTFMASKPTQTVLTTKAVGMLRRDSSALFNDLMKGTQLTGLKIALKLRKKWNNTNNKLRTHRKSLAKLFSQMVFH